MQCRVALPAVVMRDMDWRSTTLIAMEDRGRAGVLVVAACCQGCGLACAIAGVKGRFNAMRHCTQVSWARVRR